jgi:predicted nucleic-acid-binding Zn-ribbon protein
MRNGICPKCSAQTVHSQTSGVFFGNSNGFHVRTAQLDRSTPFVSFVCTTCGYFENYVADRSKLAAVAQSWDKVPVEAH